MSLSSRTGITTLAAALAFLLSAGAALPGSEPPSNSDCMVCHEDPSLKGAGGKTLFVDTSRFAGSVHGRLEVGCVDCHIDLAGTDDFPHEEKLKPADCSACHSDAFEQFDRSIHSHRQVKLGGRVLRCADCHNGHYVLPHRDPRAATSVFHVQELCLRCHKTAQPETQGRASGFVASYETSVHSIALRRSGLSVSATCVVCHGSHEVRVVSDPESPVARSNINAKCGSCHGGILADYAASVHGRSFRNGNLKSPVCTDCHGEHGVEEARVPSSRVFARNVPETCGRCHEDMTLAPQFNLATKRVASFESSFHGVALRFGELRVANCASCHGYHDILPESDAASRIHPDRIPATCGSCHANAGTNWAKGKVHVVEKKADNYWVYAVETFYAVMISTMIGGFVLFIFADLWGWRRRRRREGR